METPPPPQGRGQGPRGGTGAGLHGRERLHCAMSIPLTVAASLDPHPAPAIRSGTGRARTPCSRQASSSLSPSLVKSHLWGDPDISKETCCSEKKRASFASSRPPRPRLDRRAAAQRGTREADGVSRGRYGRDGGLHHLAGPHAGPGRAWPGHHHASEPAEDSYETAQSLGHRNGVSIRPDARLRVCPVLRFQPRQRNCAWDHPGR